MGENLENLNGKSYFHHRIHQRLPRPNLTCYDQWHIAWLSITLILLKMPKYGSISSRLQKSFSDVEFKCCQKDGKSSNKRWTILSVTRFLLMFEKEALFFMNNQRELIQVPYIYIYIYIYNEKQLEPLCYQPINFVFIW